MNKIIILLGQRVRSGSNFIGSALAQHPDIITVPKNTSFGELNLFNDNSIGVLFDKIAKSSFGLKFNENDKKLFLRNIGNAWIELLIKKYDLNEDKTLFIKSPNINGLILWKTAFPDSKIAIICRDGRDNVISSVKASNDRRTWHKFKDSLKKRINYFTGRSFINHTKEWKITANKVSRIVESPTITKFKYEELINSKEGMINLLSHFNLKISDSIVKKCIEAPVVGSSFGINSNGIVKPNWKPDSEKSKYIFTNKWIEWGLIKKTVFKLIAGQELIKLGYEKDDNW